MIAIVTSNIKEAKKKYIPKEVPESSYSGLMSMSSKLVENKVVPGNIAEDSSRLSSTFCQCLIDSYICFFVYFIVCRFLYSTYVV